MAKTPEELLEGLHQDALYAIERQKTQLDQQYDYLPLLLQRLSDNTGIDQETIIRAAAQAQFNHANISFEQIINLLDTFFINKKHIKKETQAQA